ncbi:hypothetical protein FEMY_21010 [Ferrovum myxofaciens]|uniref:Uncharacterized protein n=1 Tax=Ferrovum myxofaciens TaxID=416213 RepID=A0A149VWU2_9PROT|nr:hypothetical protein FEMY_21010 [Ferrovum myxofaciens]
MHPDESTFIFVIKGGPRGAMGFIAHDQVEGRQAVMLLGPVNDLDGVIGAEDHRHASIISSPENGTSQFCGIRGGGITQFMNQSFHPVFFLPLALLPNIGIGTHGKTVQRDLTFLCPLRQTLGQQGEAGHQK